MRNTKPIQKESPFEHYPKYPRHVRHLLQNVTQALLNLLYYSRQRISLVSVVMLNPIFIYLSHKLKSNPGLTRVKCPLEKTNVFAEYETWD